MYPSAADIGSVSIVTRLTFPATPHGGSDAGPLEQCAWEYGGSRLTNAFSKKAGESHRGDLAALHALQLCAYPQNAAHDSRNGGGRDGSALEHR
jgi:hypothetical protein